MFCQIKYTPEPKEWTYDEKVRKQALELYVDGMNLRRITRHLGTHHRTISLWVQSYAVTLPKAPVSENVKTAELDELFTFVEHKKYLLPRHKSRPKNTVLFGELSLLEWDRNRKER